MVIIIILIVDSLNFKFWRDARQLILNNFLMIIGDIGIRRDASVYLNKKINCIIPPWWFIAKRKRLIILHDMTL